MEVRSYVGPERRLRLHLSERVWPEGCGVYVGADYALGARRFLVITYRFGGFGRTT